MKNLKIGDNVRVFAKLGKMREEKWLDGIVLESLDDDLLIETKFQKLWISNDYKVKQYEKLEYDSKSCTWPAVEEFKNKYWNDLKSCVSKALDNFFPGLNMVVDEEEKIITIDHHSIAGGIEERETFYSFMQVPVWNVCVEVYYPGSRDEPPSSDLSDVGSSASSISAAHILINSMMTEKVGSYFDNLLESSLAESEQNPPWIYK